MQLGKKIKAFPQSKQNQHFAKVIFIGTECPITVLEIVYFTMMDLHMKESLSKQAVAKAEFRRIHENISLNSETLKLHD